MRINQNVEVNGNAEMNRVLRENNERVYKNGDVHDEYMNAGMTRAVVHATFHIQAELSTAHGINPCDWRSSSF